MEALFFGFTPSKLSRFASEAGRLCRQLGSIFVASDTSVVASASLGIRQGSLDMSGECSGFQWNHTLSACLEWTSGALVPKLTGLASVDFLLEFILIPCILQESLSRDHPGAVRARRCGRHSTGGASRRQRVAPTAACDAAQNRRADPSLLCDW